MIVYRHKIDRKMYLLLHGPVTDIRGRRDTWNAQGEKGAVFSSYELSRPLPEVVIILEFKVGQPSVLSKAPELWQYSLFQEQFEPI